MKEFNNRDIAKKHAEYITGKELRRYVAKKVKKYVGDKPIVFDGTCGSGQLEEFVNPEKVYGVEIQKQAADVFLENYPNSQVLVDSFFNYDSDLKADCVIMNPPFSLKYKDLSEKERENITSEFPWKKSGMVDDIFVLKSLNYTKRYGFYILFPGLTYRKAEKKFREILKDKLVELNVIENAFEDTSISVIFLVIDKQKKDVGVLKEVYDCKLKKVTRKAFKEEDPEQIWHQPQVVKQTEAIDIDKVNANLDSMLLNHVDNSFAIEFMIAAEFTNDFKRFENSLLEIIKLCDEWEKKLEEFVNADKKAKKEIGTKAREKAAKAYFQMSMF